MTEGEKNNNDCEGTAETLEEKKIQSLNEHLVLIISTGFYSGYFPLIPGTIGTALGVVIYWAISGFQLIYYSGFLLLLTILGLYESEKAEIYFSRKDAPQIVIDEIIGYLITMMYIPSKLKFVIIGFFVFRIMDIVKPFPCRQLQQLKGGTGIVIDDVIAGIYSNIILQIVVYASGGRF